MAKNFFAELKRIKYVISLKYTGDEYSFFNAPLRNFLNAIFSQAISHPSTDKNGSGDSRVLGLGGLRRSFARHPREKSFVGGGKKFLLYPQFFDFTFQS